MIDLSPLREHRDYRLLFAGQAISFFGSMITHVALPYQVYQMTKSPAATGLLSLVELVPLLATAFIGGALADTLDRRRLLLWSEAGLVACSLALLALSRASLGHPWPLYLIAAVMSALNGLHRPTLEALTPRLVDRDDIPAVAVLSSLRGNVGLLAGPAVGGLMIDRFGLSTAYAADAATYAASIACLALIRRAPPVEKTAAASLAGVIEGLRYARSRQELMGSYVVDIVAMVFGMPMALFPAIAESFGGARVLGWIYTAPAVGALALTLTGRWVKRVHRHGAAVVAGALVWGLAITAFGLSSHVGLALFFLACAGAGDMASGIFRSTIWNETIPDRLRGRLASLEMLSYMSGPMLGNFEAGVVAGWTSVPVSVVSGGVLCVIGVLACALMLPGFWRYDRRAFKAAVEPAATE